VSAESRLRVAPQPMRRSCAGGVRGKRHHRHETKEDESAQASPIDRHRLAG
jgi:hypothetical protein